jgi:carboxylate-amine ligase
MHINETMSVVALFQALVCKLTKLREQNLNFMSYRRALINENKWRACRYGIDGKMIDFGKEMEVNTRALIHELLDFISDVVDELDIKCEVDYVRTILEQGTGADRQLAVYESTQSLESVVDYICEQTLDGI